MALERIQRGRMVGANKVQQVYDLENVRYLPDRAKERRQRNAKTDFIVASDVSRELRVELLLCQLNLEY